VQGFFFFAGEFFIHIKVQIAFDMNTRDVFSRARSGGGGLKKTKWKFDLFFTQLP
jgi:hypothetical protein